MMFSLLLAVWLNLPTFATSTTTITPDDAAEYDLVENTLRERKVFRITPDFARGGLAPAGPPDISLFARQCDTSCTSYYLVTQGYVPQAKNSYRVAQYFLTLKTEGQNQPPKVIDISDATTKAGFSRRSFYFPEAP